MIHETLLLHVDLLGTFVFGLSGAMLAIRRRLDLYGIAVLSIAAAMAGGLIRDSLLGVEPPATLQDSRYLVAALAAVLVAFFAHRRIETVQRPVMVLDAVGLGFFTVSGCTTALEHGLSPLPAMLIAVLTATGGGVVRDLLVTEIPRVLREEVYALAALTGAALVVLGDRAGLPEGPVALIAILATVSVRILSVWLGWRAPAAPGGDPDP